MLFTKEQENAIFTKNKNILVSAAAGSGKTTVLVERIIQTILNSKNNTNIDDLLIVTFTRNSAEEMKNRIYSVIYKTILANPENIHLKNQLYLLNKSYITTIDSFCLNIVKKNFKFLDIDPNFKIGDNSEIELLKIDCLNDFLENLYEKEDESLIFLLNSYSTKVDDSDFLQEFLLLYNKIQNLTFPKKFLENSLIDFEATKEEDFFKTPIFNLAINEILSDLLVSKSIVKEIENTIISALGQNFEKPKFLIEDNNLCENLILLLKSKNFPQFFKEIEDLKFERINLNLLKEHYNFNELDNKIKFLRNNNFKKILNNIIKKHIPYKLNEILRQNQKVYPILKSFYKLILDFDNYFLKIKKSKKIFTFNDISHFCLSILIDENNNPTKIAKEYQEKFKEIIIDEYQDINSTQDLILSSISNGHNMFMVGDMKQCIYKFRNSNPNIFLKKYNMENDNFNEVINLNKNFRSNQNVINSINFVFEQIMDKNLGEVEYNENSKLYFSANFEDLNGINKNIKEKCEFYLIDSENLNINEDLENLEDSEDLETLENAQLEANLIVKKINYLLENFQVLNKNTNKYEPIKYKDIVILLRSVKNTANVFSKVLNENGIPAFTKTSNGFFDFIEISLILNILKIIDNPLQDLALTSVLYSPIFHFTSEELLSIKLSSHKNMYFYNQILNYISTEENSELKIKLENFLKKLKYWQNISSILSISELIAFIYENSNYYNYVGILPKGKIRQANLLSLLEKSISYEKTNIQGIFNFIKYIDKIKKGSSEGDSSVLSEDEDLVRIMSIHKSKGLEFPVVFVPMLSKSFNKKDLTNKVILHNNYGVGTSFIDTLDLLEEDKLNPKFKFETFQKNILKNIIKNENLSEEIRVLYVALTRAKEKLILIGSTKNIGKKQIKWEESSSVKSLIKLNSDSFLDWIGISLKKDNDFWQKNVVKKDELFIPPKKYTLHRSNNFEILNKLNTEENYSNFKDKIYKKLSWKYPNLIEQNLKSTNTISEIKRNYQKEILGLEIFDISPKLNIPSFYKNKTISSLEIGIIYHTLLEKIDFNISSEKELDALINNLKENNILDENNINVIDKSKILNFLNSDLANRIKNSSLVKREQHFTIGLSPYEVYHNKDYKDLSSKILVNGIIDLYFEENGEIVLIDYKTDKTSNINELKKFYSLQLNIYKKALEKSTNKKVKESIIYLINYNKYFNI